jgi:glyoxylase-like metal-dependent hydrolase (beta-lactamase superfamily II)
MKDRRSRFVFPLALLVLSATAASTQTAAETISLGDDLDLRFISETVLVATHAFPWPANSAVVVLPKESVLLIDTPYTPEATAALLDWLETRYPGRKYTAINTGFHFDNLGGNAELKRRGIPIWGSDRTAPLIAAYGERARSLFLSWLTRAQDAKYRAVYETLAYSPPDHSFPIAEGKTLVLDGKEIRIIFPGETHTVDNLVVLVPHEKLLFGGCMLISGDTPGNTQDANMGTWAASVEKLGSLPFDVAIAGHGLRFDRGLIDNTVRVLRKSR